MSSKEIAPNPKRMTLAELARELSDCIDRLTAEERDEWRRELVAFGMGEPLNTNVN